MRVISGKARGLKLDTPKNLDVRPTTDRVKESLFNIINPYIRESNILECKNIAYKYSNIQNAWQELECVKRKWKDILGKVQVTTPHYFRTRLI